MIKAVLFDLDGTLLPMDNDVFIKYYFGLLCKKMEPFGFDAKELVDAIWKGTAAMTANDGKRTNEEVFWEKFIEIYGDKAKSAMDTFEDFYTNEFNGAIVTAKPDEKNVTLVRDLKAAGYRIVLATSPVFPSIATENRIRWAGLEKEDFELYTTYENIGYCKPNPEYYAEIARMLDLKPEECIMIGNDAEEDLAAEKIGMQVHLWTDNLINRKGRDVSKYVCGGADSVRERLL